MNEFFVSRGIQVGRLPDQVLTRARQTIEKLERGQPYWKLHGKRLQRDRRTISIPLGPRWRILAEDVDGCLHVRAVISHQTYNTLLKLV